jgi:hypothetical protein
VSSWAAIVEALSRATAQAAARKGFVISKCPIIRRD